MSNSAIWGLPKKNLIRPDLIAHPPRYAAYQQADRDGKAHIYPPVVVSP